MKTIPSWKDFWNSAHSVYVSERHVVVNYEVLSRDFLALMTDRRPLRLLDWGCGEARMAHALARAGISVLLYDAVPKVKQILLQEFASTKNVRVLSDKEMLSLEQDSVDVILVHSVLQYLSKEHFEKLLSQFHTLLSTGGVLYVSDVVSPSTSALQDVVSLVGAGIRHGFLLDVMVGLARTFFSDYRDVRKKNGFTMYTEEEMRALCARHGFIAERLPNIGISKHRMLIRAVKSV